MTCPDPSGDTTPRRTDLGANGPINPGLHPWPDILGSSLGRWQPAEPGLDAFTGQWSDAGGFLRFDLILAGVINPPGSLGCCGDTSFDPFRFGPNPVFGYVEFDVDADTDTGGEMDSPHMRYNGVAGRFGGLPAGSRFLDRIAIDGNAFDSDLSTLPRVERSGEDFHIPLFGYEIDAAAIQRSDPSDEIFGAGETWTVPGYLFQRSHAYRRFSSACCRADAPIGSYEPLVQLRFQHDTQTNRTTISLVYPLTNEASAMMRAEPQVEPLDLYFTNQNSVQEALEELVVSAQLAGPADREEPEFAFLEGWENKNPQVFLDPTLWSVTVVVGGSYTSQQISAPVVWSDICPGVMTGDADGSGNVDCADISAFNLWVYTNDDQSGMDIDGHENGRVQIAWFGPNFSLFDVNYDGRVNSTDRDFISAQSACRPGDFDGDLDVDQSDFGQLQTCFAESGEFASGDCIIMDLSGDLVVNQDDLTKFRQCLSGPGVVSDPECGAD